MPHVIASVKKRYRIPRRHPSARKYRNQGVIVVLSCLIARRPRRISKTPNQRYPHPIRISYDDACRYLPDGFIFRILLGGLKNRRDFRADSWMASKNVHLIFLYVLISSSRDSSRYKGKLSKFLMLGSRFAPILKSRWSFFWISIGGRRNFVKYPPYPHPRVLIPDGEDIYI